MNTEEEIEQSLKRASFGTSGAIALSSDGQWRLMRLLEENNPC